MQEGRSERETARPAKGSEAVVLEARPGPGPSIPAAAPSEGLRGRCPGNGAAAFPELGIEALSISTARSGTAVGRARP